MSSRWCGGWPAQRGVTVLLSTHLLDEVEQVCTDVLILNHGKVAALGPVAAVVSGAAAPRSARLRTGPDRVGGAPPPPRRRSTP